MSDAHRRSAGPIFLSLGVAMVIFDSTIVNVSVPQVIRGLGIHLTDRHDALRARRARCRWTGGAHGT